MLDIKQNVCNFFLFAVKSRTCAETVSSEKTKKKTGCFTA